MRPVVEKAIRAIDEAEFAEFVGERPEMCREECGREVSYERRRDGLCNSCFMARYRREHPDAKARSREALARRKRERRRLGRAA